MCAAESTPFYTVMMPVYNEEENLRWVMPLLLELLDSTGRTFELLVIDDGSRDRSIEIVESFGRTRPEIRLIRHPVNLGPGSGFFTGLREGRGEFITAIPADLAIEPEDLLRMLAAAPTCDLVVGLRSDRSDYSLARKLVSVVNIFLVQTLFRIRIRQFNYLQVFRRSIFQRVRPMHRSVAIGAEIIVLARDCGFRLVEVAARYVPRKHGQATCGKPSVILHTVRDLLRFWARWALGW